MNQHESLYVSTCTFTNNMDTAWILYVYIVIVWVYGCTSQVCGRVYSTDKCRLVLQLLQRTFQRNTLQHLPWIYFRKFCSPLWFGAKAFNLQQHPWSALSLLNSKNRSSESGLVLAPVCRQDQRCLYHRPPSRGQ